MLIAVLEQHGGLRLADRDVFASAVGGIKVGEPAADLAMLLAIAGAHYKKAVPARTCAVGEVGLGGEVRAVAQLEQRLTEAARLGFTGVIVPKGKGKLVVPGGVKIELMGVGSVNEAIGLLG
jgi:DNA repair protein RadA/Sms